MTEPMATDLQAVVVVVYQSTVLNPGPRRASCQETASQNIANPQDAEIERYGQWLDRKKKKKRKAEADAEEWLHIFNEFFRNEYKGFDV